MTWRTGKDDDYVGLDSEVHDIGEPAEQRTADAEPKVLVFEGAIDDPVVAGIEFCKELRAKPALLSLVPLEHRLNVEIDARCGS